MIIPIVNRSQDTRVQTFRKSGGNVSKLFYQTSFDLSTGRTCIYYFLLLNLLSQIS